MKRWHRRTLAALAFLTVAAIAVWQWWPEDESYPQLKPAANSPPCTVVIGNNVHVSQPHNKVPFRESIIVADSIRTNRLFASSILGNSLVGYLSDDAGATWTTSLELIARQKEELYDESAAVGPDGGIYFAYLRLEDQSRGKDNPRSLNLLCLPFGSATWEVRGHTDLRMDGYGMDRPWIVVDATASAFRGRLYATAITAPPIFIVSGDGGQTFQFPR